MPTLSIGIRLSLEFLYNALPVLLANLKSLWNHGWLRRLHSKQRPGGGDSAKVSAHNFTHWRSPMAPPCAFFLRFSVACVDFIPKPYLEFQPYCQTRTNILPKQRAAELHAHIIQDLAAFVRGDIGQRYVFLKLIRSFVSTALWDWAQLYGSFQIFAIFEIFPFYFLWR